MPIDQGALDAVATSNLKNVAEAPAFYAGLALGNAVAHQQAMQQLQVAAVGSLVKSLTELDPEQAVSVLKAVSGQEVASTIAALTAAIASAQATAKVAGNTPPPTP